MPLENHSLVQEFPEMREQIHQLKQKNPRFAKLFKEYDAADHVVVRIESGLEAASDSRLEELKKERLQLKDSLYAMLRSEPAA